MAQKKTTKKPAPKKAAPKKAAPKKAAPKKAAAKKVAPKKVAPKKAAPKKAAPKKAAPKKAAPKKAAPKKAAPKKASTKRNRREEIVAALRKCMADQGFTAATLSDIAQVASMSSSHLLYYFPGKDAILEALFEDELSKERELLANLPADAGAALDAIAELFLGSKKSSKNDRVVMLDLAGQTIQNRTLRKAQTTHEKTVKKALTGIFKKADKGALSAPDAAHAAYAMLSGLRTSAFFDASLTTAQAEKLVRTSLSQLGGIRRR